MNPNEESDQQPSSSGLESGMDLQLDHVPRKKKVNVAASVDGDAFSEDRQANGKDVHGSLSSPKVETPIPRKKRSITAVASSRQRHDSAMDSSYSYISQISEVPFVLRIHTSGINMAKLRRQQERPRSYSSRASSKGYAKTYMELENSDSDDYKMTEDEEAKLMIKRMKRKRSPSAKALSASMVSPLLDSSLHESSDSHVGSTALSNFANGADVSLAAGSISASDIAEAPPPGELSTLWYSRECFNHVWVLEKICGWKTRPKFSPRQGSSFFSNPTKNSEVMADASTSSAINEAGMSLVKPSPSSPATLDLSTALKIQQAALQSFEYRTDASRRMEISRINPSECPIVQTIAAEAQSLTHKSPNRNIGENPLGNNTSLVESEREEVLLVKWRGRSFYHCSWERIVDIERFDISTNSTSRNKIRRFYQQQETQYGPQWKQAVEEERKTVATIHHHSATSETPPVVDAVVNGHGDVDQVEEYFSPQCLMVERILACDENEMDMVVLAKQRALNLVAEQLEESSNEGSNTVSLVGINEPDLTIRQVAQCAVNDWDIPYDPEDNVRYVVKWKGLPYTDVTWEYWRDIKNDAVEEVEDFWYRQVAPDLEYEKQCSTRRHPHIREFKKLKESPTYGVSKIPRPIFQVESNEIGAKEDVTLAPTESELGFRLRSYQLEGLNWLLFNWWNRRSCILADEMGLGKTIQSAAFLQELQAQPAARVRGPFLIVAPLSLIEQWQSELRAWAPDMNVVLYHGSADARNYLVRQEFYFEEPFVSKSVSAQLKKLQVTKFHVLITTYEVVLKDITVLSKIRWRVLIVDEAHRLKNHKARLFEELATVPRDHCVLLTGTPIANATEELWALLHFANPTNFNYRDEFLTKFGEMTDAQQVSELHDVLKPYLLRRVKEDVEKSLPNKEETILEVSLTPIQKAFYKAIYERNTSYLFKGSKPNNTPSLMNVMMELRKCCNHPFLVKGAEDRILSDAASKAHSDNDLSLPQVDHLQLYAEQLVKSSGKMVLMEKLLQKLFDGGHKVLVFSQMVRVLDLLEDLLKIKKYRFERLDGTTSSSARLHAVERFKKKECNRFVMLLSTRAGGLGLNLTVADIVIIFDSDWNPQNDMQAMARAHRIGQTKAVKVYRFLTAKTYEMHMFHSASLKLGLERAVMSQNREQSEDNDESTKNSRKNMREAQAKEIDQLLKKGAYDVFRDDDDKEAEKFMESDIDQLLERSSKTVTYGASATSSLGSGLGSFSKASFVTSTEDGTKDVDLDDPDFWSKAVGLDTPPEETPEDVAAMLDDGVKRSRKQVEQYDPYAEIASAEQLKKDRIALEKMLEKEEKDRILEEKRSKSKKSNDEKIKIHREDQTSGKKTEGRASVAPSPDLFASALSSMKMVPKLSKEMKPKKGKAKERARALREAEKNFPLIEQFKQAWEIPQRNRATAAVIRFGFGRFCKIRNESNLSSLPLQDLEIFVRSYSFQLSLQVAVLLLSRCRLGFDPADVRSLVIKWLGVYFEHEVDWMCDAIQDALTFYCNVECCRVFLRIPAILTEPIFVEDLRHGAGFRALRRIGFLARLNKVIEDSVDSILFSVGPEELGKRGCSFNELVNQDLDLKARFVSNEELTIALSARIRNLNLKRPALWWDRCCDVALILGTLIHGLSNYEAMRRDRGLPFGENISRFCEHDLASKIATQRFRSTTDATRRVFDDALEAGRVKAELEVQAAVAAAAKAALQREEDAALLRKGGVEAEGAVRNMPDTQVDDAFEFDGTDTHFVTLPRLHEYIQHAVRSFTPPALLVDERKVPEESPLDMNQVDEEGEPRAGKGHSSKIIREHHLLPMPDSRVLDYRLLCLLDMIEGSNSKFSDEKKDEGAKLWRKSHDVETHLLVRNSIFPSFDTDAACVSVEYNGVGLSGNQCGISHRTLNDGSDFSFGSATNHISQLAYGTDAPRYLRALGVPMNITRLAISSLLYSDISCVRSFMMSERLRYFGKEDVVPDISGSIESTRDLDMRMGKSENSLDEAWMHSSSRPKVIAPVDPVEFISEPFRVDAKLRATVCCAVGFFGFPASSRTTVNSELIAYLHNEVASVDWIERGDLFNFTEFRKSVERLDPTLTVPDEDSLRDYVESVLLPHCLRLCVNGNGPSTRNARGSHGDYETSFGVSTHPEPSLPLPSPLPDPCQRLQEHSLEAVGFANALLRRVRLLRACIYLCSEEAEIKFSRIVATTKSSITGSVDEMPIWWCPWIHDIALLHHAGRGGLFALFLHRSNHEVFSSQAIQAFIRSKVLTSNNFLPQMQLMSAESINQWTERQSLSFPSLYQLERRLGLLCGEMTVNVSSEVRFDFIPMFDHGGWPRK